MVNTKNIAYVENKKVKKETPQKKNKNALKKATLKKLTVIDKIGSKDADNIMKYVEEKL